MMGTAIGLEMSKCGVEQAYESIRQRAWFTVFVLTVAFKKLNKSSQS